MRFVLLIIALAGCGTTSPATFHPTDPSFRPSPGAYPKVYLQSNLDVPRENIRSVGLIEVNLPASSGSKRVIELAAEKGRELGCWILVEHSAFTRLKVGLHDVRVLLAHSGGHDGEGPGTLKAEFDCVVRMGADPAWAENDRGNGTDRSVLRGMRFAIEQAA